MIGEIIADLITFGIFLLFIVYFIMKRGFTRLTYVLIILVGGMVILTLSDIASLLYYYNPWVECLAGKFTAFGALLSALGLLTALSMFPRKNVIYRAVPSLYVISSILVVYLFATPHLLNCDPLAGGLRTSLWALYSLWVYELLLIATIISLYTFSTAKIRVERMQFLYMSIGSLAVLIYMGVAQIIPSYSDMEYFTAVHVLPVMGIFYTVALMKYGMFLVVPIRERGKPPVCELDISYREINGVWNVNAAYKSFRKEISKVPGMVITIRPPDLIRRRYVMEKTPIIWLTYFPYLYENAVIPDRLHFEVMYSVINFIDGGGEMIMIDGAEYIIENFGRGAFVEFVSDIKGINERVTVVIGVNDEKVISGFADVIVGKNCRIADPRVIMLKDDRELTRKPELLMITTRDEKYVNEAYLGHVEIIRISRDYDADRLTFDGINRIEDSLIKDLYVECTDHLISVVGEKKFMNFLKDLMDILIPRGGKIYLKYTPRALESPQIAQFIEDVR